MQLLVYNLAITGICLFLMGFYFSWREKKLEHIAQEKLLQIREKYLTQIADRKAKEKQEIEKLKKIVENLELRHRQILQEKNHSKEKNSDIDIDAKDLISKAKEKAKEIQDDAKHEARKYLDEQKEEVQTKMVDLVMGVTKKVLAKSLTYEDHKELIEKAFLEVEGEVVHDDRD